MKAQQTSFSNLDFGTIPASVPMETIEVVISAENLLGDYADAFLRECHLRQPLRVKEECPTQEELMEYCRFLLYQRVQSVNTYVPKFSRLKILAIPAFIQYCLETIGEVIKYDVGLTMVPVMEEKEDEIIQFEEAAAISKKLLAYRDVMVILEDAMPRSRSGNSEVMSTAMIAGHVRAQSKVTPASSYVSRFLGLKLRKELVFQILYRVKYDDTDYIRVALNSAGGLL